MSGGQTASAAAEQLRPYQFKPGTSGNPAGRRPGSRNKLGDAFIEALHDSFLHCGSDAIARVIEEEPAQYLRVIASLLPKQLEVKETTFSDIDDAELIAILDTVRRIREQAQSRTVIEATAQQVGELQPIPEAKTVP